MKTKIIKKINCTWHKLCYCLSQTRLLAVDEAVILFLNWRINNEEYAN